VVRQPQVEAALPGFVPEVGAALWRLQDARQRTLRLLGEMPAAYVDLETHGNSVGTILYHLALIEADWLYVEILEEEPPDEMEALLPADHRDQAGVLSVVRGQSLDQHLARLSTIRNGLLGRLRGMTAEDFHRTRSLPDYDVSPAWVLHHLAQHEAEHRGELGFVIEMHRAAET
jgi:uncharacterized damage-inducible protein DinB